MKQVKLVSYEKLEDENRELKIILNKLSHEMGNALTLLGASIYYVESEINKQNVECNIRELKNRAIAKGIILNIFMQHFILLGRIY